MVLYLASCGFQFMIYVQIKMISSYAMFKRLRGLGSRSQTSQTLAHVFFVLICVQKPTPTRFGYYHNLTQPKTNSQRQSTTLGLRAQLPHYAEIWSSYVPAPIDR